MSSNHIPSSSSVLVHPKTLIVFKGFPGVGKSTLASHFGRALSLPVLHKDDIRDNLYVLEKQFNAGHGPGCTHAPLDTNAVCYPILWKLAQTQLDLGLSVIVESPLGRKELFEQAQETARLGQARLVVVNCVLPDHEWMHRLEERKALAQAVLVLSATQQQQQGEGKSAAVIGVRDLAQHLHKPLDPEVIRQHYQGCDYQVSKEILFEADVSHPVEENLDQFKLWLAASSRIR